VGYVLGAQQYGKAETRVVRIYRDAAEHQIPDLNVSTCLRGDFADAYLSGDQSSVLPTDSQKNTAYAFALERGVADIETYALANRGAGGSPRRRQSSGCALQLGRLRPAGACPARRAVDPGVLWFLAWRGLRPTAEESTDT